jgi:hypothetical protein
MQVSRNDPFDLSLSIRGLGVMITYMLSDSYEYMYYLTFKRTMKLYVKDFNDAWLKAVEDADFFLGTGDPFVPICHSATIKLMEAKKELCLRWGIDEVEDLQDLAIILQAQRFSPYILIYKQSKSYKKLTQYYERALSEYIECLYLYACAFTALSYKIPLVLKRQFRLPEPEGLRLLNQDDNNVDLLKELIVDLKKDLVDFKALREKKYKKK